MELCGQPVFGRKKLFISTDMKVWVGILCVEDLAHELVSERVDWFLDELVAEMEARTGKSIHSDSAFVKILWDYAKKSTNNFDHRCRSLFFYYCILSYR